MRTTRLVIESELAALAKECRQKSGKTKTEAAIFLGVGRPAVQLAEENPQQSLTRLRICLIERFSEFKVSGPFYRLERKKPTRES